MNEHNYVKTILYSYPKLDLLIEAMEISVENQARLSFKRWNTLACVASITDELCKVSVLRELKRSLNGALQGLSSEELYLLEYKYFRRRKKLSGEFCGMCFLGSEREYYRRQNALIKKLAFQLAQYGVTREYFFEGVMPISPFDRIYRAVEEGREFCVFKKREKREIQLKIPPAGGGSSCP